MIYEGFIWFITVWEMVYPTHTIPLALCARPVPDAAGLALAYFFIPHPYPYTLPYHTNIVICYLPSLQASSCLPCA